MVRFLYAALVGIVGAVVVHLSIVLMLPHLSANDVWRQIATETEPYEPTRLDRHGDGPDLAAARSLDPLFAVISCRYDLTDGPFSVTASGGGNYWSVSVFDDHGRVLFSANDRIVATGDLDLVVAESAQMRQLKQNPRDEFANAIVTESLRDEGFVVLRMFRPDGTWEPAAEDFVRTVDCRANPL